MLGLIKNATEESRKQSSACVEMADLLAQFDIVERAEQARARSAEGVPGVGRVREAPVNPFDEEEELNLMPSPLEVSGARTCPHPTGPVYYCTLKLYCKEGGVALGHVTKGGCGWVGVREREREREGRER